jgi:hypothetical protein
MFGWIDIPALVNESARIIQTNAKYLLTSRKYNTKLFDNLMTDADSASYANTSPLPFTLFHHMYKLVNH